MNQNSNYTKEAEWIYPALHTAGLLSGAAAPIAKSLLIASLGAIPFATYWGGRKAHKHLESPGEGDIKGLRAAERSLLYDRMASQMEGRIKRELERSGMTLSDLASELDKGEELVKPFEVMDKKSSYLQTNMNKTAAVVKMLKAVRSVSIV